jgi:hypothetical protein
MANLNFIGDLKREYHHVKKIDKSSGQEDWEPTMVLFKDKLMGRSFMIPLSCFWKYLEPKENLDMRKFDHAEFDRLAQKVYFERQLGLRTQKNAEDAAAIVMAESLNEDSQIMLCTGFSLVKCCQLLDITVNSQSLAQLLMFIQDGLDGLKNMPEYYDEGSTEVGEVKATMGDKVFHTAAMLSDTDLHVGGE